MEPITSPAADTAKPNPAADKSIKTVTRTATFSSKIQTGESWHDTQRVLRDTNRITNYTIDGIELLLNGLTSSKIGDTPEERRLLNSFGRTLLRMPVSGTNFDYFVNKACEPGRSYNTAFNMITGVAEAQRKLLKSTELTDTDRSRIEKNLLDCERAQQAVERFMSGWHPLRPYITRLRGGVTSPLLNFDKLRDEAHTNTPHPAGGVPARWFSLLLSAAIQRIRSYQELKTDWNIKNESWKRAEPRWMQIQQFEQRFARELPNNTAASKLEFAKRHGAALLAALGQDWSLQAPTRAGQAAEVGLADPVQGYRAFILKNPAWPECLKRLEAWRDLKATSPTYTRCHPELHPMWVALPAPQSGGLWSNLTPTGPGRGTVDLSLMQISPAGGVEGVTLAGLRLGLDGRFDGLSAPIAVTPGAETTRSVIRQYHDAGVGKTIGDARLGGARLMLDNPSAQGPDGAYLEFVVKTEVPRPEYPKGWGAIPEGAKLAMVTFGYLVGGRADTLQVIEKRESKPTVLATQPLKVTNDTNARHQTAEPPVGEQRRTHLTSLESIQAHLAELDTLRSATGRLARGQSHNTDLQRHINNSVRDLLKKTANQVVRSALESGADYVVVPFLEGVRPNKHQDSALNRLFMTKARGMLVEYLEGVCQRASLPLLQLSPFGLRELCSDCGEVGAVVTPTEFARPKASSPAPAPHTPSVFGCSCCGKVSAPEENMMNLMVQRLPFWGAADKRIKFAPKLVAATELPAEQRREFFVTRRAEVQRLVDSP